MENLFTNYKYLVVDIHSQHIMHSFGFWRSDSSVNSSVNHVLENIQIQDSHSGKTNKKIVTEM
jgi:hypothetical protein